MELKIGDSVNADPSDDDIARAVDAEPQAATWHIHLQSNGDDFIEAFAAKNGLYRLSFVDRGRRFNAASPIEAAALKAIFIAYLNDDTDWRGDYDFVPDKARGRDGKPSKPITSEPPPWAIILVAAAFFGTPAIFFIVPNSTYGIVWLVAGPMLVMALAMVANKMLQARRAAAWPQAAGRITKSAVAQSRHQSSGDVTEVTNVPQVEYEFSANGAKFTGTRISIGEDKGGANTEATLAHYPVGAAVVVYYDPNDPQNCLLEREIPKEVPKGCLAILAVLAAVGLGGHWLVVHFLSFIAPHMQDGPGRTMVIAGIVGLVVLMLFLGSVFAAREKVDWSPVRGKVLKSGTESYRKRVNRTTRTFYAPVVEYSYLVNGHEYHSRQIELDVVSDGGSRAEAEAIAARYPQGGEVEVHYDPENPGTAALENPGSKIAWYLLVIAVACFGVALYAGRIPR